MSNWRFWQNKIWYGSDMDLCWLSDGDTIFVDWYVISLSHVLNLFGYCLMATIMSCLVCSGVFVLPLVVWHCDAGYDQFMSACSDNCLPFCAKLPRISPKRWHGGTWLQVIPPSDIIPRDQPFQATGSWKSPAPRWTAQTGTRGLGRPRP